MKKAKSLIEILVRIRTHKALDRAAKKDSYYRTTLKEQDKAYDKLDSAGLDKEQKHIVENALCALNANGAAYGKAAYRLGFHDGIQFMSEVHKL